MGEGNYILETDVDENEVEQVSRRKPVEGYPDLSDRTIFIATPAYEGKVHTCYANSLVDTCLMLHYCGAKTIKGQVTDSGSVPRTRNMSVARARAMGATDLFFVDADMGWLAPDFVRMCMWPHPIVAAAYPARSDENARYIVIFPENPRMDKNTGLLQSYRAGTGFMRIKMEVFEKMEPAYPNLHFRAGHTSGELAPYLYRWFNYTFEEHIDEGTRGNLSEDYAFCELAKSLGYQIWIDPNVTMRHEGRKHWEGNFGEDYSIKLTPDQEGIQEVGTGKKQIYAAVSKDPKEDVDSPTSVSGEENVGLSGADNSSRTDSQEATTFWKHKAIR